MLEEIRDFDSGSIATAFIIVDGDPLPAMPQPQRFPRTARWVTPVRVLVFG